MGATTKLPVTTVAPADAERAVAVIVLAFGSDPAARWTYPDAHDYITYFPAMVRAFGGGAFAAGTAHRVGQFAGAALWLPPGLHPDEAAMQATLERSLPAARLREIGAVFERMRGHHPREPHWYLPVIGVDPAHQNQGHGSALLRHALAQCDRDGMPAYLESSNPANISLYERHGFVVLDTIQVGSSPSISPMLRTPR
jgi:ribosomal protein S18 acetylase RimI-like enzyme